MKMPKNKPLPVEDEKFAAAVREVKALNKEIGEAQSTYDELVADRDKIIAETVTKWRVSHERFAAEVEMGRPNISRIVQRMTPRPKRSKSPGKKRDGRASA